MTEPRPRKVTLKNKKTAKDQETPPVKKIHRRIHRACDDCRGRKIKCDGGLPCGPCEISGQDCTYNIKRKSRYKGPVYIEELEGKVKQIETESRNLKSLLSTIFPTVSLEDLGAAEALWTRMRDEQGSPSSRHDDNNTVTTTSSQEPSEPPNVDELLETTTEVTGRLEVDEQGRCKYHGDFSGLAFLDQMGERCSQLLHANSLKPGAFPHLSLRQVFASESFYPYGTRMDSTALLQLPLRSTARRLSHIALNDASCLMTFVDVPTFNKLLDRIYSMNPQDYTRVEELFLPLLYSTLAVGELFSPGSLQTQGAPVTSLSQTKGLAYFRAGQALLDATDCRDIISLQAIIYMIIYLQSTASVHTCYSYISIAVSASLQMGLHRSTASENLDPVERETRKRTFWVIRIMETYVTTLLGLPSTLDDVDIDQRMPSSTDINKFSVNSGISLTVQATSTIPALNVHITLMGIMRHVVHEVYPRAKQLGNRTAEPYRVSYRRIIKIEEELDLWFQTIPIPAPAEAFQPEVLRTQLLLRLAYAHVQMVLYRPFVHHIISPHSTDVSELRSFACASACIKAAMQIIWIVEELDKRGLLLGAFWFTVYITFSAVMTLCMFVIGCPDDPTAEETMVAAKKGRDILSKLALESLAAGKCVASLGSLFERISLMCTDRRRDSLNSLITTEMHISQPSAYDPADYKFNANSHPISAANTSAGQVKQSDFDMSISSTGCPSLVQQDSGFVSDLEESYNTSTTTSQQLDPALFTIIGPPLNNFCMSTPTLAMPVYNSISPLENDQYFSCFSSGWEDQMVELGTS